MHEEKVRALMTEKDFLTKVLGRYKAAEHGYMCSLLTAGKLWEKECNGKPALHFRFATYNKTRTGPKAGVRSISFRGEVVLVIITRDYLPPVPI